MKRTFRYAGKGHTVITLPGATEETKVRTGETVTVEFAEPHMAHPGYARYLNINGFREAGETAQAVASVSSPEKPKRPKK
jgi:hypothetical protein